MLVNIYNYKCANKYFADKWMVLRANGERYSIRSISRNLGITSHSILHEIIHGRRKISKKYIEKISLLFNLKKNELEYFELLVYSSFAKSEFEKLRIDLKLEEYKRLTETS
jgi:uncharacterized protein (TIGR02147 family)